MHAECKKRSLVVNLTHEITGTDVADKRILFRLKHLLNSLKRFPIDCNSSIIIKLFNINSFTIRKFSKLTIEKYIA